MYSVTCTPWYDRSSISGFGFLMDLIAVDSCFCGDKFHCILSFACVFLGRDFTIKYFQKQNWLNFYCLALISAHCPLEYSGTNIFLYPIYKRKEKNV